MITLAVVAGASAADAQGRCMTIYGAPSGNTSDIAPVFAPTGWKMVPRVTTGSLRLYLAPGALYRGRKAGCVAKSSEADRAIGYQLEL